MTYKIILAFRFKLWYNIIMSEEKYSKIKQKREETKIRRGSQRCRVFELKINTSHMSIADREKLKMFFVEAKWIYNHLIANAENPFDFKYTSLQGKVSSLDKDKNPVVREIKNLPAKQQQDIIYGMKNSILALSKAKKSGRVGKLKFKTEYNGLELSQYGTTHKIVSRNHIKLNGIKKPIRVHGLNQIYEKGYEFANAKLVMKPTGYYLMITTYENITFSSVSINPKPEVGLDFGIKTTLTTSDRKQYNVSIKESERLKRLQAKFARTTKGSNNRYKLLLQIKKEYERSNNKKRDASNKIISDLLKNYSRIYYQDESLSGWHESKEPHQRRTVQSSCLGRLKLKLGSLKNQAFMIEKYFPSTQLCYKCLKRNDIGRDNIYKCECGLEEQRDIKAAKTILMYGQNQNLKVPMEHREIKPATANAETGSPSL